MKRGVGKFPVKDENRPERGQPGRLQADFIPAFAVADT